MKQDRRIEFQFDYKCAPIWLDGDVPGNYLISSEGSFVDPDPDGKNVPEERLKGEVELEREVKLIYNIYSNLWRINKNYNEDPLLFCGFTDEHERTEFFGACNYVIKRMKEIFGSEFYVGDYTFEELDDWLDRPLRHSERL